MTMPAGLTPDEKRALLERLLKNPPATGPASFMTQHVVLSEAASPGVHWNMQSTIRYFDKVDPELLRSRVKALVERHATLRTTYEPAKDGKTIVQRIRPQSTFVFDVQEASEWTPQQLRERLRADACQLYDLRQLPICRVRLYQRRQHDIVQVEVHHVAGDLWSLETLIRDMENPPKDSPPTSYLEYCLWQQTWVNSPQAKEYFDWWQAYLQGCPSMNFGTRLNDPSTYVTFRIEPDVLARAREVARTHKVTLFNQMLSALQVALRRWTAMNDFAIICAAANRLDERFKNTVGYFANSLMYRQNLTDVPSWEVLWTRNRTLINDVLERQAFPLLQAFPVPRSDMLFMFQQYQKADWSPRPADAEEFVGMRTSAVTASSFGPRQLLYVEPDTCPSPLVVETVEERDTVEGILRYRFATCPEAAAAILVQDVVRCFRASVDDPSAAF